MLWTAPAELMVSFKLLVLLKLKAPVDPNWFGWAFELMVNMPNNLSLSCYWIFVRREPWCPSELFECMFWCSSIVVRPFGCNYRPVSSMKFTWRLDLLAEDVLQFSTFARLFVVLWVKRMLSYNSFKSMLYYESLFLYDLYPLKGFWSFLVIMFWIFLAVLLFDLTLMVLSLRLLSIDISKEFLIYMAFIGDSSRFGFSGTIYT